MQVSWIDPDEIRDLLAQIEGPPVKPAQAGEEEWDPNNLSFFPASPTADTPRFVGSLPPEEESSESPSNDARGPVEMSDLDRIRERLRSLREQAKTSGMLVKPEVPAVAPAADSASSAPEPTVEEPAPAVVENKGPENLAPEAAPVVEPVVVAEEAVPVVSEAAAIEAPAEVPAILPVSGLEPVSADFAGPAPQSVESQPVFDHSVPEATEPAPVESSAAEVAPVSEAVAATEASVTAVEEPTTTVTAESTPLLVHDEPLVQLAGLIAPELPAEPVPVAEQVAPELLAEPALVAEPVEPEVAAEAPPVAEPAAPVEPAPVVVQEALLEAPPPAVEPEPPAAPSMAPALAAILAGTLPEPVPAAAPEVPEPTPEPEAVVEPAVETEPVASETPAAEATAEPAPVAEVATEAAAPAPVEPEASAPVAEAFAAAETAPTAAPLVFVAAPPKPEEESVVAPKPVAVPFVVPALGLSDRLNAFALWACERLNTQEVLLIDDFGDVLWGGRAPTPLVLSTMTVWQAAQRTAAESAGSELHRVDKDMEDGSALTVLSVRTRYGVVSCSTILPRAMSEADEEAIRTGLVPAVEGV